MSRYISEALRNKVAKRALFRYEYCRIHSGNSFFVFHIDHIVSLKHSGPTTAENLAYTCQICNNNKGSDIATFLEESNIPVRFFNPRIDNWNDHFIAGESGLLEAKTDIGTATIKILDLNHPDSIIERREMIRRGIF
ncbi:HNH endonuclease [Emticicia sp. TH156]|uniref:HNH endonuclease n=1 Tax=Emticicia sp. TH156 TaxID=2067454 RepID=UPI000C77E078|nr:HNH endonuclease signature motif containing protein [Emticicia sp. TH156]PLK46006.1 HNH endonuclease [Emticicia sp. TH156]